MMLVGVLTNVAINDMAQPINGSRFMRFRPFAPFVRTAVGSVNAPIRASPGLYGFFFLEVSSSTLASS